ncbi:hypothetical protein CIPAW_06G126300 [Carya illinoinensis]|uniref:Uncharacterized protein n=1 Tax=Carya illinoinensis TaxID=32201 RepID=A0A8T1QAV6_CARIL|nr:hypothetical protein CIPAW_06G126300 [Carya illinoinensis]KAG6709314.1 hypothetical protein I3842_06G126500 [Carya illinoinensis]
MSVLFPSVTLAKQILRWSALPSSRAASTSSDVPRGFLVVYLSFQNLLRKAEEEFRLHHPTGGLTIPCKLATFMDVTSRLSSS